MPKQQTTMRITEETQRQLDQLVTWWGAGTTRTDIVATAIDRMYIQESERRAAKQELKSKGDKA